MRYLCWYRYITVVPLFRANDMSNSSQFIASSSIAMRVSTIPRKNVSIVSHASCDTATRGSAQTEIHVRQYASVLSMCDPRTRRLIILHILLIRPSFRKKRLLLYNGPQRVIVVCMSGKSCNKSPFYRNRNRVYRRARLLRRTPQPIYCSHKLALTSWLSLYAAHALELGRLMDWRE